MVGADGQALRALGCLDASSFDDLPAPYGRHLAGYAGAEGAATSTRHGVTLSSAGLGDGPLGGVRVSRVTSYTILARLPGLSPRRGLRDQIGGFHLG